MARTCFNVNARSGHRLWPAKRPATAQLAKQIIRQRNNAREVGMLSIVIKLIVENSVGAQWSEDVVTVDQHGVVLASDAPADFTKVGRAAQRQAVEIACLKINCS